MTLRRGATRLLAATLAALGLWAGQAAAQTNGSWTETTGDGAWSSAANWSGGVANGADGAATFNVDADAVAVSGSFPGFFRNAIQLDTARTIGNVTFGDSNASTPGGYEIYTNDVTNNVLTLAGTTPTITVGPLGPFDTGTEIIDDAIIRPSIAGTAGLTKSGAGVLTLASTGNSFTGGINVNQGTLRLAAGTTFTAGAANDQVKTIGNGATLEYQSPSVALGNVKVAAGATATLKVPGTGSNFMNGVSGFGTGETLNVVVGAATHAAGATYSPDGDWGVNSNSFQQVNFVGLAPTATARSSIRLRPNGGNFANASFANTRVHLDNVNVFVRTNSFGNTIPMAELSGTATAQLSGGNTGSSARYQVGSANTNSTFAGTINGAGGMAFEKVGTGTLTLSGGFTGTSVLAGNTDPGRKGGVIRVSAGTLAITGATSIPGGVGSYTDATAINVVAGATLDVSGAPGTFQSSPLQRIMGSGTIKGAFNHAAGRIQAGDLALVDNDSPNTGTPVATAGIITFDGNLSFNGGEVFFDMNPTPGGDDLIQVTGVTNLTGGGVVNPNFLSTAPIAGLTYTFLNSAGGFGGTNPSAWSVLWPGRGPKPVVTAVGNTLQFTTTTPGQVGSLTWTGANSGAWDVQTTQNWRNNATNNPDTYFEGDNVTFPEAGVTNRTVDITVPVSPTSVTVDSTSAYTFAGTGVITGAATFTKRGSSTLTMQKANTFTGAARIEGGAVDIGAFGGAFGTGQLTLAGGTILVNNTAGTGFTNSAINVQAATTNTIQADGTTGTAAPVELGTLTGDGTLTVTSTIDGKVFGTGNTSAFTGVINFQPAAPAVTLGPIRFRGGQTTFPDAVVNLTGTALANQQGGTGTVTFAMGELHGDAASTLDAFTGGSGPPNIVWQIGNLNTNSDFAGLIIDGEGGPSGNLTPSIASIDKVGTGSLTLTGANTYTGDTRVSGGLLSINSPYLASGADVYLSTGSTFNLNFSGTNVIDSLFIDGSAAAVGTWGSLASTATNRTALITGDGILDVTTAPAFDVADFNHDGSVNGADHDIWVANFGTGTTNAQGDATLNNDVDGADILVWQRRLVLPPATANVGAVPEPTAIALAACGLALTAGRGRRR